MPLLCPCGTDSPYHSCCRALHSGEKNATTAAQLMRSRYSAYYLLHQGQVNTQVDTSALSQQDYLDYLLNTHRNVDQTQDEASEILQSAKATAWSGLYLVSRKNGMAEDKVGEVEFIASFEQNDSTHYLHENSRFKKINGRWYYLDGEFITSSNLHYNEVRKRYETKVAFKRNDACWCDSGKKYKKCHAP